MSGLLIVVLYCGSFGLGLYLGVVGTGHVYHKLFPNQKWAEM